MATDLGHPIPRLSLTQAGQIRQPDHHRLTARRAHKSSPNRYQSLRPIPVVLRRHPNSVRRRPSNCTPLPRTTRSYPVVHAPRPARALLDASGLRAVHRQDPPRVRVQQRPSQRWPLQEMLQVLIQTAWLAIRRIQAAYSHPATATLEVGNSLQSLPGQRRPGFLPAKEEHQSLGGIARYLESSTAGRSCQLFTRRSESTDRTLNTSCPQRSSLTSPCACATRCRAAAGTFAGLLATGVRAVSGHDELP
jgi:hypothetical protein